MKILAGPSIRRTHLDIVYIWFIVDELPKSFKILMGVTDNINKNNAIGLGELKQKDFVRLGEQMYVLLIPVYPVSSSFPPDTKIYYQVLFNNVNLDQMGLCSGDNSIVYEQEVLPSFYIPTKHHHILQGSCRKPHAVRDNKTSQYDHFITIDNMLQTNKDDMSTRPSMLCLTGDQIYADDVALPLLCALKEEAKMLTGWTEEIPHPTEIGKTIIPDKIEIEDRSILLTDEMGFTSRTKNNHLLSFGEIMAMYMACWGNLEIILPRFDQIKKYNYLIYFVKLFRILTFQKIYMLPEEYEKQRQNINNFLSVSKKVRRVFANITTYMIFNDHECTDYWNLNKNNYDRLRKNPLSRR